MQVNDPILSLITAQLNQTATPQQQEQLQHWLEASPANRQEYETWVSVWEESGTQLQSTPFDVNTAWAKIDSRLSAGRSHGKQPGLEKRTVRLIKQIAVAASVVIIAGAGYYFWARSSVYIMAAGGNQPVTLPDGSVVVLRKGSAVTYPRAFSQQERTVQLDGEALFQVKPNKAQPFLVLTPRVQVRVTGTSFLVRSATDGGEVVVASGRVIVKDRRKTGQLELVAGQKAVLYSNHLQQVPVADSNYIAWKTGVLDFRQASLLKVLDDLQRYYALPIRADSKDSAALAKTTVTVHFERQPLDQVLDELLLITGLRSRKENGAFILYKK